MSNKPSKRPSRSVQRTDRAVASARPRAWIIAAGVAVAVILALGLALLVRPSAPPPLEGPAARGQELARTKGCTSCHSPDGSQREGPTWDGLAGSTVRLADGTTVTADDAYLTRAIRDPRGQQVAGFRVMPTVPATDDEVAALVAYIKALG